MCISSTKTYFLTMYQYPKKSIFNYLKGINLPKHSMEQREPCEGKRCIKKWKTRKHQVIMVLQNNF